MLLRTTENVILQKIDFKELHNKFSEILRNKIPYEAGLKIFCHHFSVNIVLVPLNVQSLEIFQMSWKTDQLI